MTLMTINLLCLMGYSGELNVLSLVSSTALTFRPTQQYNTQDVVVHYRGNKCVP